MIYGTCVGERDTHAKNISISLLSERTYAQRIINNPIEGKFSKFRVVTVCTHYFCYAKLQRIIMNDSAALPHS